MYTCTHIPIQTEKYRGKDRDRETERQRERMSSSHRLSINQSVYYNPVAMFIHWEGWGLYRDA